MLNGCDFSGGSAGVPFAAAFNAAFAGGVEAVVEDLDGE
jgi:hypothetical protein